MNYAQENSSVHTDETPCHSDDLVEWARGYVEVDEAIRELESKIKPIKTRIKELKLKRKNTGNCIIGALQANDVEALKINNGSRFSIVRSTRKKPTLKAIVATMEESIFKDDPEKYAKFNESALAKCQNRESTRLVFRRRKNNN